MHIILKVLLFGLFFPFSLGWVMLSTPERTAKAVGIMWFGVKLMLIVCFFPLSLLVVGMWWGRRHPA